MWDVVEELVRSAYLTARTLLRCVAQFPGVDDMFSSWIERKYRSK
jgi:hypothetical protein